MMHKIAFKPKQYRMYYAKESKSYMKIKTNFNILLQCIPTNILLGGLILFWSLVLTHIIVGCYIISY